MACRAACLPAVEATTSTSTRNTASESHPNQAAPFLGHTVARQFTVDALRPADRYDTAYVHQISIEPRSHRCIWAAATSGQRKMRAACSAHGLAQAQTSSCWTSIAPRGPCTKTGAVRARCRQCELNDPDPKRRRKCAAAVPRHHAPAVTVHRQAAASRHDRSCRPLSRYSWLAPKPETPSQVPHLEPNLIGPQHAQPPTSPSWMPSRGLKAAEAFNQHGCRRRQQSARTVAQLTCNWVSRSSLLDCFTASATRRSAAKAADG